MLAQAGGPSLWVVAWLAHYSLPYPEIFDMINHGHGCHCHEADLEVKLSEAMDLLANKVHT